MVSPLVRQFKVKRAGFSVTQTKWLSGHSCYVITGNSDIVLGGWSTMLVLTFLTYKIITKSIGCLEFLFPYVLFSSKRYRIIGAFVPRHITEFTV